MRSSIYMVALSVLLIGLCLGGVAGQGVTVGYTVYVSFFYPFHFLYNPFMLQSAINQVASLVEGTSYDGSMLIIPVRTESLTISLTASTSGYASGPLTYYYMTSPAYWPISGTSTVPVQSNGGDYWITVNLS